MNKRIFAFILVILIATLACSAGSGGSSDPGILFKDDFSSMNSGWDRDDWENGFTDYDNDIYRIVVKQTQYDIWAILDKSIPADVKIEVEATRSGGPDVNLFGVICRYSEDTDAQTFNFYYLVAGNDGYVAIILIDKNESTVLDETFTEDTVNPNSMNLVSAVCNGSELSLSVNGKEVLSVQDSTLTSGNVGLVAGSFDDPNVDIVFDNFVVTKP